MFFNIYWKIEWGLVVATLIVGFIGIRDEAQNPENKRSKILFPIIITCALVDEIYFIACLSMGLL